MKSKLLFIVLLFSLKAYSQGSVGTTLNLTSYSQQQYYNTTISLPGFITNTGNQAIQDSSVSINCAVDTGNGFVNVISSANIGQVSLQPGDTSNFIITFPVSPNGFRTGNNIVVVWPVMSSPSIQCETVYVTCEVLGYTGLNDMHEHARKVFPNPCKDKVFIPDSKLKQVRIYNCIGELLMLPVVNETIDLNDFKPGIYSIEIESGKYVKVAKE